MDREEYRSVCRLSFWLVVGLLLISLALFLSSCRSGKHLTNTNETLTEIRNDTTVIERLVPVSTSEDSARIRALLECDKNGRVLLSWYDQECSRNTQLRFLLDSLGRLMADFRVPADTVYVPVKDTTIINQQKTQEKERIEVPVEKKLNGFQRYLQTCGIVLNVLLFAGLIYLVYRVRKKILSALNPN